MTWQDIIHLHVVGSRGGKKGLVPLRWTELPDSLLRLAGRMGVRLDSSFPVEIAPSWLGARALCAIRGRRGRRIRLGGALARKLSPEALDGVLAHELAHLKCRHWELLLMGCLLAAVAGVAAGLAVSFPTVGRLVLGGTLPVSYTHLTLPTKVGS
ncbi:MAG: M48 family metalloprotease [Chloroflexi bacterium]|nr:M48 family metalloprotease [Chloroflexota bacterium]